jgi:hypothetical protein
MKPLALVLSAIACQCNVSLAGVQIINATQDGHLSGGIQWLQGACTPAPTPLNIDRTGSIPGAVSVSGSLVSCDSSISASGAESVTTVSNGFAFQGTYSAMVTLGSAVTASTGTNITQSYDFDVVDQPETLTVAISGETNVPDNYPYHFDFRWAVTQRGGPVVCSQPDPCPTECCISSCSLPVGQYHLDLADPGGFSITLPGDPFPSISGQTTGSVTFSPCTTCPPAEPGGTRAVIHVTRAGTTLEGRSGYRTTKAENEVVPAPPTRSAFIATWSHVSGATSYHLDISTSSGFRSYVNGYRDLDVGQMTSHAITGLKPGTTYYYRVRSFNSQRILSNSAVERVTTSNGPGLIINPAFDSSITGDPNAAGIEAMIIRAISIHESLFADKIIVSILFRYAPTAANGCTGLGCGVVASSETDFKPFSWDMFVAHLIADNTTRNDAVAIASLPQTQLSSDVSVSTANARALGLDAQPKVCANGCVQSGCPYDGIITLNSLVPFAFTRPPSPDQYDAQRTTEHEIDEVMGLSSFLGPPKTDPDVQPQDLFSWASAGTRNLGTSGQRYFSIDSGLTNIVNFNQLPCGDFGDWQGNPTDTCESPPHCPQVNPYVQNVVPCPEQVDDISVSSPEGTSLDVIGYDLAESQSPTPTVTVTPTPRATPRPRPTPHRRP